MDKKKDKKSKVYKNIVTRNKEPNFDLMAKGYINLYYMNKEAQRKKEAEKHKPE